MYDAPTISAPPTPAMAALFGGLADPTRLELLRRVVRDGPQSVGDLVEASGIRQPSVSKHLACLHGCGLLERERRGRVVVYSVCNEDVVGLLDAGERVWAAARCGDSCECLICCERG